MALPKSTIEQLEQLLLSHRPKLNKIKNLKNEDLIDQYNEQAILGILGVHAQALKLLELRKAFIKRFDKSPILIEDDIVISLMGKIDATFFNT